jgi:hypothetical protein
MERCIRPAMPPAVSERNLAAMSFSVRNAAGKQEIGEARRRAMANDEALVVRRRG